MKHRVLIVLLSSIAVQAQFLQVGGFVHGGFDLHLTNFQSLPGTFSCSPGFSSTSGGGFSGGFLVTAPAWSVELPGGLGRGIPTVRLFYDQRTATFRTREQLPIAFDNTTAFATIEHRVTVGITAVTAQVGTTISIDNTFLVEPSFAFSTPLPSRFDQGEYLVEPTNRGRFRETGTRERNIMGGTLLGRSRFDPAVVVTAGWSAQKTTTYELRPELSFRLPLGTSMAAFPWRTFTIRIGMSALVSLLSRQDPNISVAPAPVPDPEEFHRPTTTEKSMLVLDVQPIAFDHSGYERVIDTLKVHVRYRQHIRPLLPYVFFEEGSDEIPARYSLLRPEETGSFDESELAAYSTLEAYYHILDIIGARMRKRPQAEIQLIGCTMGTDSEQNRLDLAWQRAHRIQSYLHTVWGIDTARIHLAARNLPAHPSMIGHPDGNAENARVEIVSSDPAIMAPLVGIETDGETDPRSVALRLVARPTPSHWFIRVYQNDSLIMTRDSSGQPPTRLPIPNLWKTISQGTLRIEFSAEHPHTVPPRWNILRQVPIAVRADTTHGPLERYSLILFDFNDASIPIIQQPLLDVIRSHISPSTRITITGYTDRMGDRVYNIRLADRRATAVARALGVLGRATINAIGNDVLLYDNTYPEGRFYSRTIEIELAH